MIINHNGINTQVRLTLPAKYVRLPPLLHEDRKQDGGLSLFHPSAPELCIQYRQATIQSSLLNVPVILNHAHATIRSSQVYQVAKQRSQFSGLIWVITGQLRGHGMAGQQVPSRS